MGLLAAFGANQIASTADRRIYISTNHRPPEMVSASVNAWSGRRINYDPLRHPVHLTCDVFPPLETRAIFRQ